MAAYAYMLMTWMLHVQLIATAKDAARIYSITNT